MNNQKTFFSFILSLILIVPFFLTSCTKSVESESKRWERNKITIQNLKVQYPGFATPLEIALKKGEALMKQANQLGDEEAKIKKMAEANNVAFGGFVSNLSQIERKKTDLEGKLVDLAGVATDEGDRRSAEVVRQESSRALQSTNSLKYATAGNLEKAGILVLQASNSLDNALRNATKVISRAKKKTTDNKKKEKLDKQETKKQQNKAKENWKCAYCGKLNAHNSLECGGCGGSKAK